MIRRLILVAVMALPTLACSAEPTAEDSSSRVLFVTQSKGFTHSVVNRNGAELAPAEIALRDLGQKSGLFTVESTQDTAADFTRENLKNYDIVAFYTTGTLPIAAEDLDYFLNDWARQPGHGVLGFHSAMDTYPDHPGYLSLIGGNFVGHAWNAGDTVHLTVHDPDHPIAAPYAKDANEDGHFVIQDEIYQYRDFVPGRVRVLMSLNYEHSPTGNGINTFYGHHVPVAWVRSYGKGKVYCNNLGHNAGTWANPTVQESILQGVRWMRGEVEADSTPNPAVSAAEELKAVEAFESGDFKAAPQDRG